MGRLWLALVLVVGLAAPAFADVPHVPGAPTIKSAYLEIGQQRTSAGLYDVDRLDLVGTFDRYASTVRVRIGDTVVETTPDKLVLVKPALLSPLGSVTIEITSYNGRIEGEPTRITVVAQRYQPTRCGEMFGLLFFFGAIMGIVLMFGVLLWMRATEVTRARIRKETEPTGLANDAAEAHIRSVAMRALLALVVVTAVVVAGIGADVLFALLYGGPVLFVVAATALVRVINAGRAIALLHRPEAAAQTRHDQLEVTAAGRHVTLRSSPRLVARARRDALPRATL